MYRRISWEMVKDSLGNAEHTLGTNGLSAEFFPLCSEDLLSTTDCI